MSRIPGVEYEEYCEVCDLINHKKELIVYENDTFVILLKPKPFNNGHLIITTRRHVDIYNIDLETLTTLFKLLNVVEDTLRELYNPHGINIGIFCEKHLSIEVVPRWVGDLNFLQLFLKT